MCSINHDLKAIFIHIPKTGGSYIHNILRDCYGFNTYRYTRKDHKEYNGDDSIKDDEKGCNSIYGFVNTRKTGVLRYFKTSTELYKLSNITKEQWNSYTKFTFVRNPYDKIISAWKFIHKVKPTQKHNLINFLNNKDDYDNSIYSHSFIPQYTHLIDENNELSIDYFGRFENLNEDLIYILKKIGVTKITHHKYIVENIKMNQSSRKNYSLHYTNEILEVVNNHFDVDFDKLNFDKFQTIEQLIEDSKKYYLNDEEFNLKNKILVDKLENENILDTIENLVVEKKIQNIKTKNESIANVKMFLNLTSEQTKNNKQFHSDIFMTLLQNFSKKMNNDKNKTEITT